MKPARLRGRRRSQFSTCQPRKSNRNDFDDALQLASERRAKATGKRSPAAQKPSLEQPQTPASRSRSLCSSNLDQRRMLTPKIHESFAVAPDSMVRSEVLALLAILALWAASRNRSTHHKDETHGDASQPPDEFELAR